MTLRARLSIVLVAVAAAGLLVMDAVTYTSLRSFLTQRVDQQLDAARGAVAGTLVESSRGQGLGRPQPKVRPGRNNLPPGTYGELRTDRGVVLGYVSFEYGDEPIARPALPEQLPPAPSFMTVAAVGDDSFRYRVLVTRWSPAGGVLAIAIPLNEVSRTLNRLLLIEGFVTVGILAVLSALAWWIVQRGLRPLDDMAQTAGAIAGGNLSQRIDDVDPKTEVGRLGLALNTMLGRIEHAFVRQKESEDRLRRFVAEASHELRTPLTSIRGYAELFRRGAKERPADLAKAMKRIEDEAARMGVLVEELLLLARLDQGRPLEREPVALAPLAADAVLNARASAPDRTIEIETSAEPVVAGDEARLRQVAANLLSNALLHTPPGTNVHVRVGVAGDHAVLEVADDGPGMTAEDAARAFERFYRSKDARAFRSEGSGLGLSIVASIVEAHRGRVDLQTAPGRGARFRVTLPLASDDDGSGPAAPGGSREPAGG